MRHLRLLILLSFYSFIGFSQSPLHEDLINDFIKTDTIFNKNGSPQTITYVHELIKPTDLQFQDSVIFLTDAETIELLDKFPNSKKTTEVSFDSISYPVKIQHLTLGMILKEEYGDVSISHTKTVDSTLYFQKDLIKTNN